VTCLWITTLRLKLSESKPHQLRHASLLIAFAAVTRMRGSRPEISLMGNMTMHLAANAEHYFEDPGAKCTNGKGESFSRNIVIGGQWVSDRHGGYVSRICLIECMQVDLSAPGTYFTKYACADDKGVKALDVYRKIVVHGDSQAKHSALRL
jgi:hypothetical protein